MLKIAEIFLSIQGESTYSGLPCIFIRLSGCNLKCNYCDSEYANKEFTKMEIIEILSKVEEYAPINLVEITGGEPLLQDETILLIKSLLKKNYKILLETNGSVSLENVPPAVIKIVDVKTPASDEGNSFFTENLKFLNEADEIKFVISNKADYLWAKKFIDKKKLIMKNILFSVVFSRIKPKKIVEWIIKDKLNVRFQLQIHKYIWSPDKKGV